MEKEIEKGVYISIPLMFLLGSVFHFVFEWFGKVFFIAPFFPVNESIWEHTKLAVFPLIIFYGVYYFLYKNKNLIDKRKWFSSLLVSIIISIVVMIGFYYTYKGILGKDYTLINIFDLLLSLFVSQICAFNYYKSKKKPFKFYCLFIIIIVFLYALFTFFPFKIPLFYDFSINKYSY